MELRSGIGDWLFGCDVCQEVCPWNTKPGRTAPLETAVLDNLNLSELFELSEEQFRARYRRTPLWRTRRRGILRNAAIVIGNSKVSPALPALKKGLWDTEPIVRGASAWALGQIGTAQPMNIYKQGLSPNRTKPSSKRSTKRWVVAINWMLSSDTAAAQLPQSSHLAPPRCSPGRQDPKPQSTRRSQTRWIPITLQPTCFLRTVVRRHPVKTSQPTVVPSSTEVASLVLSKPLVFVQGHSSLSKKCCKPKHFWGGPIISAYCVMNRKYASLRRTSKDCCRIRNSQTMVRLISRDATLWRRN